LFKEILMANVVITGANRGVGLALVQRYADAGDTVLALCRNVAKADRLAQLAAQSCGRVTIGALDIADPASIEAAAAGCQGAVDQLINNAGILGGTHQSLDDIDFDEWMHAFKVMTLGPFRVTRAFLPHLTRAGGKVLFVSSQVAASTWPHGGYYAYCSAKAAGNRVAQILAIDLRDRGISVASVHPGHVKTDMGGPNAQITPAQSAAGIRQVMAQLNLQSSGTFFNWNGDRHPL
jgi:NAD(P)-dependent dehydrogenase (short-subunit alcohol dehydrogenase family)